MTDNTTQEERSVEGMHLEFVGGGDPGPEVVAAVTALLTRPIVVMEDAVSEPQPATTPWGRAARLESIVHGRRITTRADLAWRR